MESAIPQHLQCPRSRMRRIEDDYAPPYPAWVARSSEALVQVVMFHFGVQYADVALAGPARAAIERMTATFGGDDRPVHHELAAYKDEQGYETLMLTGYWTDPACFSRWWAKPDVEGWWLSADRLGERLGYFKEVVTPVVDRFETLFSSPEKLEGIGVGMGARSLDDIQEHGYWGSMRDRLPASQTDALTPAGSLMKEALDATGARFRVKGHGQVALIRSGQDWTVTDGEERTLYIEQMEPVLREGMDFIRDDGLSIGCYTNRYMTNLDEAGAPITRSFGLSYWRCLADMERWAEAHPTHIAIFGGFMRIVQKLNFDVKLKLYHEVSILREEDQDFEYINCHARTGLMNAVA